MGDCLLEKQITVGSLYSGIGGMEHHTITRPDLNVLWAVDFNKQATEVYKKIHPTQTKEVIHGDILRLDASRLPPVDILTAGFPCQPFSAKGHRLGFDDPRGNHAARVAKIAHDLQPTFVFLENVKGILFNNHMQLNTIKGMFADIGYTFFYWKLLDMSNVTGIPQHRERVYMVASKKPYTFSSPSSIPTLPLNKFLQSGDTVQEKYYFTDKDKNFELMDKSVVSGYIYSRRSSRSLRKIVSGLCPTLTANTSTIPVLRTPKGIRKLTPSDYYNLMGFDEWGAFDSYGFSDTAWYRLLGNAVTPSITRLYMKQMIDLIRYGN